MISLRDMTEEKNSLLESEKSYFRSQVNYAMSQELVIQHDAIKMAYLAQIERSKMKDEDRLLTIF